MLIHMIHYKQTRTTGLSYRALITYIFLAIFGVDIVGGIVDSIHIKINYSLIRRMMVHIFHGELRNKLMDEDEVITQPAM